jgi:hypothetical protein
MWARNSAIRRNRGTTEPAARLRSGFSQPAGASTLTRQLIHTGNDSQAEHGQPYRPHQSPRTLSARCAVFLAAHFLKILARWNSMVRGLSSKARAISLLESPSMT